MIRTIGDIRINLNCVGSRHIQINNTQLSSQTFCLVSGSSNITKSICIKTNILFYYFNCKKTTCRGFNEILVDNESDVKQTKSISNKPLSIVRQNCITITFTPHEKWHSPCRDHKTCVHETQDKIKYNIRKGPTAPVRSGLPARAKTMTDIEI